MLISVERTQKEYAESDQAFLITMLTQLRAKLVGMFEKYVEEQFKFIEEARNKTKRKGVLPFMRIFPVSHTIPLTYAKCTCRSLTFVNGADEFVFFILQHRDLPKGWRRCWKVMKIRRRAN